MEQLSDAAVVFAGFTERDGHCLLGDGRKVQVPPATLLEEMADEIVGMEALHDDDDRAVVLVIEARQQCVGIPLLQRFPCDSRTARPGA